MRERGENKGLNQPEHPVRITSSAELMPARSRAAMLACSTFKPLGSHVVVAKRKKMRWYY